MMKTSILSFIFAMVIIPAGFCKDQSGYRDLYSDTWTATDALGRKMPDISSVGPVKNDHCRVVGIFYITWHSDSLAKMKAPYTADVSNVLNRDPNARLDGNHPAWEDSSFHWGQPEMGYFLSKDKYVIQKDISMLTDAGIDVLIMDVTNATLYWDEWSVFFPLLQEMKAKGNKVPQFCFWAFNGPVISVVQELYEKIYKAEKYKDLWFYWDGKPLLLYNDTPSFDSVRQNIKHPNPHYEPAAKSDPNHPHYGNPAYTEEFYQDYSQEVKNFFTLRTMWWGSYQWADKRFVGMPDKWSFGYDLGDPRVKTMEPNDLASTRNGIREQAAVTPAQHPITLVGKSWSRKSEEPQLNEYDMPVSAFVPRLGKTVSNPEGYGIYFQERWDEAVKADPQFLYLNDWNEWTAGKYPIKTWFPEKDLTEFMRRQSNYMFIDQYNAEFNRSIQPMKDGYTDNYYMQMAQNIRRYKGVRPIPELKGMHTIQIDGRFEDWKPIAVEYRDTIGDTVWRDYPGYGGWHYKDALGRNDIITAKTAIDAKMVYFYAETQEPLTPQTDPNWMLLLIDSDANSATGWYGYDYLVNKTVIDANTTTLLRYSKTDNTWAEPVQIRYNYAGKSLELGIPRSAAGLKGNCVQFDFHWCDNPAELKDPISLCLAGDSAPNRRFNYRCIWKSKPEK